MGLSGTFTEVSAPTLFSLGERHTPFFPLGCLPVLFSQSNPNKFPLWKLSLPFLSVVPRAGCSV